MRWETARFRITGVTPLLQHNFEKMMSQGSSGLNKKKIPAPAEEAELGTYRLPTGQLYLSVLAFRSALLSAAKGKRVGKYAAKGIIAGAVLPGAEFCGLEHPETNAPLHEYEVFTTRAVVQGNGVMRSRPMISAWACSLEMEIDVDAADPKIIEDLLSEAGARIGVGDWRPEKGGHYGRFRATLV